MRLSQYVPLYFISKFTAYFALRVHSFSLGLLSAASLCMAHSIISKQLQPNLSQKPLLKKWYFSCLHSVHKESNHICVIHASSSSNKKEGSSTCCVWVFFFILQVWKLDLSVINLFIFLRYLALCHCWFQYLQTGFVILLIALEWRTLW